MVFLASKAAFDAALATVEAARTALDNTPEPVAETPTSEGEQLGFGI